MDMAYATEELKACTDPDTYLTLLQKYGLKDVIVRRTITCPGLQAYRTVLKRLSSDHYRLSRRYYAMIRMADQREPLAPDEKMVYDYFVQNPGSTRVEAQASLDMSYPTLRIRLDSLAEKGYLKVERRQIDVV